MTTYTGAITISIALNESWSTCGKVLYRLGMDLSAFEAQILHGTFRTNILRSHCTRTAAGCQL